jgi:Protein of unknown function (DUF3306)
MTEPEKFVARWSRLKRGPDAERRSEQGDRTPPPDTEQTGAGGHEEATAPQPDAEEPAGHDFDPANLPPIDTITVETDIRGFLRSGVPAELTRAALRRAWVSDPAIRDFIGIAENQWDFTDPGAIPGFGPLRDTDDLESLVAQALGEFDKVSTTISDASVSLPQAVTATRHETISESAGQADQKSESNSVDTWVSGALGEESKAHASMTGPDNVDDALPRTHRSHGGALPR